MSLNNFHRIFSIILIAFSYLFGQVQDTTGTSSLPETRLDKLPEQISETSTDKKDQQDSKSQYNDPVANIYYLFFSLENLDQAGFLQKLN